VRDSAIVRRQRHGVCHRCGWRGNVGTVSRRGRRYVVSGREYGRLCDDCVAVLSDGQSVLHGANANGFRHVKLTVLEDRDVA
jgi:hypothetical protein